MAIYEYTCQKCSKPFELMRNVAQRDDPTKCPNCGSKRAVRKQFQAFAIASGAAPDAFAGDGEMGDFGGDDDFGGLGMDDDDFDF